jgi:hypothetical protein
MICGVLGDRFLEPKDMYSLEYSTKDRKVRFFPVKVQMNTGTLNNEYINQWKNYNNYIPYDLKNEWKDLILFQKT